MVAFATLRDNIVLFALIPYVQRQMALTFPHNYTSTLDKVVIRVDNEWFDCTAWRHSHPGGAQIIDQFHNQDATDAFHSLHSAEAVEKLRQMKGKPVDPKDLKRDTVSEDYMAWRKRLEAEGWFNRNWILDFLVNIAPVMFCVVYGTMISGSSPVLASFLIGLAMQQCGWLGHDYSHGRGTLSNILGAGFGGLINGFSKKWWSQKHNAHHTFPNRKEFDSDVHNEPILHLWFPDANSDVWWRRYQHIYYPAAYAFLYVSWRMQSIQYVLGSKDWIERALIVVNYIWLATLPWKVAVGSVLLGGFFVAFVVTANHQTEEILAANAPYNFVVDQYRTTRGIRCSDYFFEYFFGGMQYQLEHHLFPTMPRYYYPLLRAQVLQFAKDHNLRHDISGVGEILKMNYEVMRTFSAAHAKSE